jgi:hypothetical protein
MKDLLPEAITIGDTNIGTPSPGRPTANRDKLTSQKARRYIRYAQEQVDARLRAVYVCPLRRTKTLETTITEDISSGSNVSIKVNDGNIFSYYDVVEIRDQLQIEETEVKDLIDSKTIQVNTLSNNYSINDGTTISILEFPDPIPLITARLACATAFDELFASEQAPDLSNYGKTQRDMAFNALDSILDGTILLFGQEYMGRRFIRAPLFDAISNPVKDFNFGREKS